tara:strand:- start:3868 stop:4545 length:678 start_codon:yes stop_codon:yes gene_type:complete
MKDIIIAAVGSWNKEIFKDFTNYKDYRFHFISSKTQLINKLKYVKPKIIFFIHWRNILEKKFIKKYFCICFHMTDLPYGRGGSPLQNLILKKKTITKLTAFKMNEKIDSGDYILKKKISLKGAAHEIYKRTSLKSLEMIKKILSTKIKFKKQRGKKIYFKRRSPFQSKINNIRSLNDLYDFIRMLDAPSYPKAYLNIGNRKIFFYDAKLDNNKKTINCNIKLYDK